MVAMKRGALTIVALFLFTIALAVSSQRPEPAAEIGMLTGLSLLRLRLLPETC